MKSYDLIRKYGWEIMPWLSNLGVNLLADSNVFFVDSGQTTTGLDAVDGEHGNSFEQPFLTANFAVSQCTENAGDVILLAPGHTETINDLGADGESGDETDELVLDKAGVTLLGIGSGLLRPTFTIGESDTTASINITAENVTVKNIIVKSGYADTAVGITVAAVTGVTIEDCIIRDGTTNAKELVIGISVTANADDIVIRNNTFSTWAGGDCANAIKFAGGCDRAQIVNNTAFGKYTAGCLLASGAVSYEMVIKDNVFVNAEAAVAIALNTSCTGILSGNHLGGTTSMAAALTGDNAMWCFENYISGAVAVSGVINPAVDSE